MRSVWKPQVFSPPRHCRCSFGFVGWALLLATRFGFGRPFGRLALRSLRKPQVFSPPRLCRCSFDFCWLGAPLADSPRFWAPLWPTRLAFPLETPSFFPTAPLSLSLSVYLVGPSCCQLASVLCAPFANSPCVASGNPKFFLRWAPLLRTRLALPLGNPGFFPT